MKIFDRLMFFVKGGRQDYLHRTKENKKATKVQDFLSEFM